MHPFSLYIQILAKGRNNRNSLTQEQAYQAMKMITCYDVEPEQIGAFLMLLKVKELSASELAGFTQALKESIPSQQRFHPNIDWAAYAGKERQLPWFVLAALVLAEQGFSVFMHGMSSDDDKIYVNQALLALDFNIAKNLSQAEAQLKSTNFAYLDVVNFSSLTMELIEKKQLFSIETPLYSIARMLNPMAAPLMVIGDTEPNLAELHQQAALLLQQTKAVIINSEEGEFERIPDSSQEVYGLNNGQLWQETWEQTTSTIQRNDKKLDLNHFKAVWCDEAKDDYAENSIIGTLAVLIKALELEVDTNLAQELAKHWWQTRLQTKH